MTLASEDEGCGGALWNYFQQVKHVMISGIGFFSDAYDLFIINIVLAILVVTEGFGDYDQGSVSTAALAGAIIGQLAFGFVADIVRLYLIMVFLDFLYAKPTY
jgi:MFS family permease